MYTISTVNEWYARSTVNELYICSEGLFLIEQMNGSRVEKINTAGLAGSSIIISTY